MNKSRAEWRRWRKKVVKKYLNDANLEGDEAAEKRDKDDGQDSGKEGESDSDYTIEDDSKVPFKPSVWEPCIINGEKVSLPVSIFQLHDLSQILSTDVWNKVLSQEDRNKLKQFLPPGTAEEQEKSAEAVFKGENIFFGNPLQTFEKNLRAGFYHPRVVKYRQRFLHLQRKDHVHALRVHNNKMLAHALAFRRQLIKSKPPASALAQAHNPAPTTPSAPTTARSSANIHNLLNPEPNAVPLHNSQDAHVLSAANSNSFEDELETGSSSSEELSEGSDGLDISSSEDDDSFAFMNGDYMVEARDLYEKDKRKKNRRQTRIRSFLSRFYKESDDQDIKKRKTVAETDGAETPVHKKEEFRLPEDPNIVFTLFPLIRDTFDLTTNSTSFDTIVSRVQNLLAEQIPPNFTAPQFVSLALNFLANPPPLPSAGAQNALNTSPYGDATTTPSAVMEAFVKYDAATDQWFWIAKRDKVTVENLQVLELLFFFAATRGLTDPTGTQVKLHTIRQQRCVLTIKASTPEQRKSFQEQEIERYKKPDQAFTYTINGIKSVVAPMRRGPGNPSNKPREHFLLKTERPPHINLLCLVRDAASRLPGGVGTRPDVCVLLRDSQYVVENVAESQINTVVSGALDRLHSEADPCVKFDPDQKLWIYMHRYRSEEYFSSKVYTESVLSTGSTGGGKPKTNRKPRSKPQ